MNYFFLSVCRYIWKVSVVYIVAILVTTTYILYLILSLLGSIYSVHTLSAVEINFYSLLSRPYLHHLPAFQVPVNGIRVFHSAHTWYV